MAKRSSETFVKRQKEMARREKAQRKAEKRQERRKIGSQPVPIVEQDELMPPVDDEADEEGDEAAP